MDKIIYIESIIHYVLGIIIDTVDNIIPGINGYFSDLVIGSKMLLDRIFNIIILFMY